MVSGISQWALRSLLRERCLSVNDHTHLNFAAIFTSPPPLPSSLHEAPHVLMSVLKSPFLQGHQSYWIRAHPHPVRSHVDIIIGEKKINPPPWF
jgi:hypothetical protein